jgi:hypothetical protein
MASRFPMRSPFPAPPLAALLLASGCNAVFGINEGQPRTGAGGAGDAGGEAGGGEAAGGAGGGEAGGGGGEAGGGGGAGGPACGPYDGDGTIAVTAMNEANIESLSFGASASVSGYYDTTSDDAQFSIAGYDERFCGIGVRLSVTGQVVAGRRYTPVSRTLFESGVSPATPSVFLTFGVSECAGSNLPQRTWESYDGGTGSVTVDSISGTRVSLTITDVALQRDGSSSAQGWVSVAGNAHADCFYTQ